MDISIDNIKQIRKGYGFLALATLVIAVVSLALPLESYACNVCGIFTSIFGTFDLGGELCRLKYCFLSSSVILVIASIAIFFFGAAILFSRVDTGKALTTLVGIILLTSADDMAMVIVGTDCDSIVASIISSIDGNDNNWDDNIDQIFQCTAFASFLNF